ncbi:50S ribosomal protein L29 [Abyssibacter profundi]|jgi:large subunit ribosomal protein L29|uniref:Large ribosomal subunit protein uL29 n=1 Tax=Abyssibacter profundi TaxID=2182787 RepID=A0A363UIU1_9GAMM|nr:50S ribosomal protein L29 [Abyssibacter profundi]PWN55341.1 50S ribosomal protein L29 [Abyssibacter profundi]
MKAAEYNKSLAAKSDAELQDELLSLAREHFNLRMQMATGQLTQVHQIREVKRNIARVKTAISARSILEQAG